MRYGRVTLQDLSRKEIFEKMKILHVTPNYPTTEYPIFGIFVKEQVESLQKIGVDCDVFFSNGKEEGGVKAHKASIKKVRKLLKENHYDVIHCHHSISGLILLLAGFVLSERSYP